MNLLTTPLRRRVLFAALYFSEGAPMGFVWYALPAELRLLGLPVDQITGLAALVVIPWTLKFAWAPLVELGQARWGGWRLWIIGAQAGMVLTLLPLLWLHLRDDFGVVRWVLLGHALAAATQDVSIDALCIRTTAEEERGRLNGWMQVGMLAGRSLFGGGALLASAWLGAQAVVVLLLVATGATACLVWGAVPPEGVGDANPGSAVSRSRITAVKRALLSAAVNRRTWLGLAFALTGGAAFEALGAVQQPLLIDSGWTREQVGAFLFLPYVSAMAVGALLGGWLADRTGHVFAAKAAVLGIAVLVVATGACTALIEPQRGVPLAALLFLAAIAVGVFTASSYALFMDLTTRAVAATQFSMFMGATNACEAWAGFAVGRLVVAHGYFPALAVMAGLSLLGWPLLRRLRGPHPNGRDGVA